MQLLRFGRGKTQVHTACHPLPYSRPGAACTYTCFTHLYIPFCLQTPLRTCLHAYIPLLIPAFAHMPYIPAIAIGPKKASLPHGTPLCSVNKLCSGHARLCLGSQPATVWQARASWAMYMLLPAPCGGWRPLSGKRCCTAALPQQPPLRLVPTVLLKVA